MVTRVWRNGVEVRSVPQRTKPPCILPECLYRSLGTLLKWQGIPRHPSCTLLYDTNLFAWISTHVRDPEQLNLVFDFITGKIIHPDPLQVVEDVVNCVNNIPFATRFVQSLYVGPYNCYSLPHPVVSAKALIFILKNCPFETIVRCKTDHTYSAAEVNFPTRFWKQVVRLRYPEKDKKEIMDALWGRCGFEMNTDPFKCLHCGDNKDGDIFNYVYTHFTCFQKEDLVVFSFTIKTYLNALRNAETYLLSSCAVASDELSKMVPSELLRLVHSYVYNQQREAQRQNIAQTLINFVE